MANHLDCFDIYLTSYASNCCDFFVYRETSWSRMVGDSDRVSGRMRARLANARDNFRQALERRHSGRLAAGRK